MWIQYDRFGDVHDRYCLTLGRAMLLMQSFEDMCKRTLIWWNAAKRISEGEEVDLQGMALHPECFMEKFLGIALEKLTKTHKISQDDAQILRDAKDARNYVAHEATCPCFLPEQAAQAIKDEMVTLDAGVQSLARGHNLLACWAYEFEEGEPRPFTLSQVYPQEVARWVMAPIRDALQDGQ
jgi:hypothetical protein